MSVIRYDLARFSPKTTRTPQGFLRAPASFTRAGVFLYRRADGTVVRELRPADEVFKADSMQSLANAPVLVDHPDGFVTPHNATKLAKGWVSEQVNREDNLLVGHVTIMDQTVIDRAGKDLKEISLGYKCRIDHVSGTDPEYGEYDQIQRDIVYNHASLGGEGWGRAGSDVGLRLDAEAAVLDDTLTPGTKPNDTGTLTPNDRADSAEVTPMEKITINGIEFEVSTQVAQAIRADRKDAAAKAGEYEALQGRHDALVEKVQGLEQDLAEANSPERFDSAVADRVALLASARKVLGDDAEIKGSSREIHEMVLKHDKQDADFSGKSDEYVAARFDALLEDLPAKRADESKRKVRQDAHAAATGGDNAPAKRYDSNAARQRMLDRHLNAWKGSLTDDQETK